MTDEHDPVRATLDPLRDARPSPDLAARIKAETRTRRQAHAGRPRWQTAVSALVAASLVVAVAAIALPLTRAPATRSTESSLPSTPPTAGPSASASQVPVTGLQPNTIARATDELSIGSTPVEIGQSVFIVAGPTDHEGVPSYLIQHFGDIIAGYRPDGNVGWITVTTADEKLVARNPTCPGDASLAAVAALQPFEKLLCFGDRDLTFEPVTARDRSWGAKLSRRWISSDGEPDFFTGLAVYGATGSLAMPDEDWFRVTGHFDDPSSSACGDPGEVVWCRERFIVTAVTPVDPPETVLRGAWRPTRLPPIDGRDGHAMVWTGTEAVVWGGTSSSANPDQSVFDGHQPRGGAAYDPVSDRWRRVPDAPIPGRAAPVMAWTGSEVVVFGGLGPATSYLDGAAWNPATNRWRTIAAAPLTGSEPIGAWLADRLIVVTSTAAAAYDPSNDRWTELPVAPIRPGWRSAAVAAGRLFVIAFGDGATPPVEWAVIDPGTATWRHGVAPVPPLEAGIGVAGGERIVVTDTGVTFDPITETWGTGPKCEGASAGTVWTGRYLLGVTAAWDAETGVCLKLPPGPPREPPFDDSNGREFPVAVWTGSEYITWSGGNGGDIVWVPKDGAVFRPDKTLGATP